MVALNQKTQINENEPIVLTGLAVEEMEEWNHQKGVVCYNCHRREGQSSFAIDWRVEEEGEEDNIRTPQFRFLELDVEMHGIGFRFYLCHECHILINGIAQMTLKQKDKEEDS
jgi:hypothetical protein